MKEVFDEPSKAEVTQGAVLVTGPDSVDVAMTPAAALRSAERISSAAVEALIDAHGNKGKPGALTRQAQNASIGAWSDQTKPEGSS